jgi:nucleoside-diphosphate-sugar epimerase
MDLTFGEQQYSYLYIKDMARSFLLAVESDAKDGIYNLASDTLRPLKDIILAIKDYVNPNFQLNFGVLPYRKNQSMINGSINTKAQNTFGIIEASDFTEKLIQTIEYYKAFYDSKR